LISYIIKVEGRAKLKMIEKGKRENKNILKSDSWEESVYVMWMRL